MNDLRFSTLAEADGQSPGRFHSLLGPPHRMIRRRQLLDLEVSGEFSQPDVTVAPRYAADELPAPLYGSAAQRRAHSFGIVC
jgi:hypothetical protein